MKKQTNWIPKDHEPSKVFAIDVQQEGRAKREFILPGKYAGLSSPTPIITGGLIRDYSDISCGDNREAIKRREGLIIVFREVIEKVKTGNIYICNILHKMEISCISFDEKEYSCLDLAKKYFKANRPTKNLHKEFYDYKWYNKNLTKGVWWDSNNFDPNTHELNQAERARFITQLITQLEFEVKTLTPHNENN